MIANSAHGNKTSVLLFGKSELVVHLLAAELQRRHDYDLCGRTGDVAELMDMVDAARPAVAAVFIRRGDYDWHRAIEALRAADRRRTRVLVIDEEVCDVHLRKAIAGGAIGYRTRTESSEAVVGALAKVSRGDSSFAPEVAAEVVQKGDKCELRRPRATAAESLSARELEVMVHLARGLTVRECAAAMKLADSTVDNHKTRLMQRLGVHRITEVVRLAIREGLIPP